MTPTSHIEIYQSDDGQPQIELRLEQDTLRLSQARLAELLEKKEGELDKEATIRKFQIVRQERSWETRQQPRNPRFFVKKVGDRSGQVGRDIPSYNN